MTKRYDDPIEVELEEDRSEGLRPAAFWWRGRRYAVEGLLKYWREARGGGGPPRGRGPGGLPGGAGGGGHAPPVDPPAGSGQGGVAGRRGPGRGGGRTG